VLIGVGNVFVGGVGCSWLRGAGSARTRDGLEYEALVLRLTQDDELLTGLRPSGEESDGPPALRYRGNFAQRIGGDAGSEEPGSPPAAFSVLSKGRDL